jgi:hypothetical protein
MTCSCGVLSALISVFSNDDLSTLVSMVGSAIRPTGYLSRQTLLRELKLTFPGIAGQIDVVLLAAYYGATECFDFLFPHFLSTPPFLTNSGNDTEFLTFAYSGGNLHIITLCHQFLDVRPDFIHEAFLHGHLSTFLLLVASLQEPYWLPPIPHIEHIVIERLYPLESSLTGRAVCDRLSAVFARMASIFQKGADRSHQNDGALLASSGVRPIAG